MKTTKFYGLLALCAGCMAPAFAASAQDDVVVKEEAVSVTEFTCDPSTKYFSNWRNNWFIQIGAGINQPFVEQGVGMRAGKNIDHKKMTVTYNFGFGRWFSPYLAFRVNMFGGALHWDTPTVEQPLNGWTKGKHANVNVELMWDMFNSIGGVDEDRVFSIIPFVGIGGEYMWDIRNAHQGPAAAANIERNYSGKMKNSSWTLPVSAGLQFRFRLCKYVDFFGEARASFYGDNWNGVAAGRPVEANVAVYGGFNFNIGGRGWNGYNECADMAQIASLNNEVNNLRAELLGSAQTIADLQSQLPCPEVKNTPAPVVSNAAPLMTTVRFKINSDVIEPNEEVNVYNMAEWLKQNPKQKVVISGYADKDTGTSEYNMELSQKRANAVADQLINKYGIAKDRLVIKADGSDVQPYPENNWNRIVIFSQDK